MEKRDVKRPCLGINCIYSESRDNKTVWEALVELYGRQYPHIADGSRYHLLLSVESQEEGTRILRELKGIEGIKTVDFT